MTSSGVAPLPVFGGTIGPTVAESEPAFAAHPHPGESSPNVVIVLLDDVGFAQFGCYGSDIDTPAIDALASGGAQFTNFHVTPLCSPTRASLLTGRSQHAVGMRTVSNFQTGYPHQLGHISDHAGTVAEVLAAEGYATFCAGKWHLAPTHELSAAGPFGQWPLARGFDRYYGFLEAETDQFHPELVVDNHRIDPPAGPEDGYHVSEDLVDQLLQMINDSRSIRPDRPFFAYLAFGAAHAPHQAPAEFLEKYRGRYDEGWDVVRTRWFERQKELGVIGPDVELSQRNPGVEPWDDLTDNERRLATRLQEAFAAFLDHTDVQIGRFVEGLRAMGDLDDTVFVLLADNGASQEGGQKGTLHELKWFNGIEESPDDAVARLDEIGGPNSHANYPWGWAQCGNAPFRWYKQNTHEGGVHVPMIVHWPDGIDEGSTGTKRSQFVNVADIVPTIYDLLDVAPPPVLKGREQLPVTGHSFASALTDPAAPATNRAQYFENGGSRAIIAELDGIWWKAVVRHERGVPFDDDPWELYDLDVDPSELNDLANAEPERLDRLIALWWTEAEQHGVLPLDDRNPMQFAGRRSDRSPHRIDGHYSYQLPITAPISTDAGPNPGGRSWSLLAHVDRARGDEGVLYAFGNANSGLSVFVQNDRLVFDYNAFGEHVIIESDRPLPEGDVELTASLIRHDRHSGSASIAIDGEPCGRATLPLMMLIASTIGASVGQDHGSAVSNRYSAPFAFTGTLHALDIEVGELGAATTQATTTADLSRQ